MSKPNRWSLNPTCKRCPLNFGANPKAICLKGKRTDEHKRLIIYTDYPDFMANNSGRGYVLDVRRVLDWSLQRMSIDPEEVAYDYTLRCYCKQTLPSRKAGRAAVVLECNKYRFATLAKVKPRAIVVLGQVSLEAFTGKTQLGEFVKRRIPTWEGVVKDYASGVWVYYSVQYLWQDPGEIVGMNQVLWMAAKEAGLKPKINPEVPPFQWPEITRR